MLRWPARLLLSGAASCFGGWASAETPVGGALQASAPAEEVSRWIQELDSDSYAVRERASAKLLQAGPGAVERLSQAVADPSIEVATRAGSILQRIAAANDEATLNQIVVALQKLGSKRAAVRAMIADVQTQQRKFKHTRAVAQVRALGGSLSGNWEGEPAVHAEAVFAPPVMEDVGILPAIALVDDVPVFKAPEAPLIEEAPVPKRGIIGLLERLIAPADAPVPAFFPPSDLPIPVEAPDAVPVPAPRVAEAEPALVPPDAIPRFDAIPELPAIADPIAPPAPEAIPAFEDIAIADDIVLIEPAFMPVGVPIMIDDGADEEGEAYAELVLDKSFRGGDKDLAVLKDIPEIYNLSIHGAKLSDEALPHIAALPRLTTLNVKETTFTAAGLRKLRLQRPELTVICRSSAMLGINAGMEGPCVLTSVFFKSGAHDAGLRDGDEIIEVDGQKVRDFSDLTISVYPHKPGDKVSVKYRRNNEDQTAEVLLKPRAAVEE